MASGTPPVFPREITSLTFFFNNFTNSEEAACFVINNNRGPGTFLLRPSTRNPGTLTLTISTDHNVARHVNVQVRVDEESPTGVSFFIITERLFTSFSDLYVYYSLNAICNLEMVSNVRLLNPLDRASFPLVRPPPATQGPPVMVDEIPPLPRKSSVSSMSGAEPVRPSHAPDDGRRVSATSQADLPAIPPIAVRHDRPSLDSQGNDLQVCSGSSSGSGTGVGTLGPAPGAVQDLHGVQYLAAERGPESPPLPLRPSAQGSLPPAPSLPRPAALTKKELKEEQKRREKEEKKNKKEKKKKSRNDEVAGSEWGWCRPPIPAPQSAMAADDEPPYYSTPRPYKDHLDELKKMLRESEMCDCGLRMIDAELVRGWTVHRSRESDSNDRVFYQHENGNTTWHFPDDITDLLSNGQVEFITRLCRKGRQDLPAALARRLQRAASPDPGRGSIQSTSLNSSRSRSSSNSSDQLGSSLSSTRGPPFDPRPFSGQTEFRH